MDVRRLRMLLQLSRLGSMHEVADALGTTTSSVSQGIAALARDVGSPLLEPDGRRVRLTPAGRRLGGGLAVSVARRTGGGFGGLSARGLRHGRVWLH